MKDLGGELRTSEQTREAASALSIGVRDKPSDLDHIKPHKSLQ